MADKNDAREFAEKFVLENHEKLGSGSYCNCHSFHPDEKPCYFCRKVNAITVAVTAYAASLRQQRDNFERWYNESKLDIELVRQYVNEDLAQTLKRFSAISHEDDQTHTYSFDEVWNWGYRRGIRRVTQEKERAETAESQLVALTQERDAHWLNCLGIKYTGYMPTPESAAEIIQLVRTAEESQPK